NAQWPATWDSTSHQSDYPVAITVDAQGNVITVGKSKAISEDFITIKYDRLGTLMWTKRYNGPDNGQDTANDVITDADGNVYVTGQAYAAATAGDMFIIKYDANGAPQWQRRVSSSPFNGEYGLSIALRSDRVAVTGLTFDNETSFDVETVMLDTAGNVKWKKTLSGQGDRYANGASVAFGPDGSLYVGANIGYDATGMDMALIKYSAAGAKQWVRHWDGGDNKNDGVDSIRVAPDGTIVVAGTAMSKNSNSDYAALKFDSDGNRLWVTKTDFATDQLTAMNLDSDGNLYLTGYTSTGGFSTNDYYTVKLSGDGVKQWAKRYSALDSGSSTDVAVGVDVDNAGNVYVAGWSQSAMGDYGITTVKYGTDGSLKNVDATGEGDGINQMGVAMAIDKTRNRAFIAGYTADAAFQPLDFLTIRS
ncbi:MAG TPA: SBBP repeat-containing protein, partial [Roseimicrobium sp.]|nr:SBBP repeat-containing protein [Roseimicrobium sp.]